MADFPRTRIGTLQHATHGIFGGKNKDSDAWEEMVMNAWFLRRCLLVQIAVTVTSGASFGRIKYTLSSLPPSDGTDDGFWVQGEQASKLLNYDPSMMISL